VLSGCGMAQFPRGPAIWFCFVLLGGFLIEESCQKVPEQVSECWGEVPAGVLQPALPETLFASVPGLDAVTNCVGINAFGMSEGLRSAGGCDYCGWSLSQCCCFSCWGEKETGKVVFLRMLALGTARSMLGGPMGSRVFALVVGFGLWLICIIVCIIMLLSLWLQGKGKD